MLLFLSQINQRINFIKKQKTTKHSKMAENKQATHNQQTNQGEESRQQTESRQYSQLPLSKEFIEQFQKGLPEETKKKMEELKKKIDEFTKKLLQKFDKYVLGVALLPPEKFIEQVQQQFAQNFLGEQINPQNINPQQIPSQAKSNSQKQDEHINVLILIDDTTSKMSNIELEDKLIAVIIKIAQEIDTLIKPQVLTSTGLKENCFDGKYEILRAIAMSAPFYDPQEILAAIKVAEIHKDMVLKKFDKYIVSYVAAGSMFRGEKSGDIDVYIVIDDTDVKKMTRAELKDKLRAIILNMGFDASRITGVQKAFHVQTYILTDFWDNIKDANPVIFTFLRDGVPLFDRGVFMPWKLLLQSGRIRPSPEAIDINLELGEKLLERIKMKMLNVLAEDLYYAVLNPAQAAIMLYGLPPPTPKETISVMSEIFVKKENLLEKEYVDFLEKIKNTYKDIEHGKTKEVPIKLLDEYMASAKKYMERIKRLFTQIEEIKEKESILDVYSSCVGIVKDLLVQGNIDVIENKIEKQFLKIIEKENIPITYEKIFAKILKAKKDFEEGKLTKYEINQIKKEAYTFIKFLTEFIQRKRIHTLERSKVRFKYATKSGDKFGELIFSDKFVFLIKDLGERDKIEKGKIQKDGSIFDVVKSSIEELEKEKQTIPYFITDKTINSLKKIIGSDVEILVNY